MKNNFGSKLKNWLLGNDEDDEEDFLDPILEERRKEKVSTPVSYQAPVEEKKPAPAIKQPVRETVKEAPLQAAPQVNKPKPKPKPAPAPKPKSMPEKKVNKPKQKAPAAPAKDTYVMTQIISPMSGVSVSEEEAPVIRKKANRKKKFKMNNDELIPVISPIFGPEDEEEQASEVKKDKAAPAKEKTPVKTEAPKKAKKEYKHAKKEETPQRKPQKPDEVINNVEDRLKNIASLTEQTEDDMKIIEERTGKFKLDFKKEDDSLINEVDDNMSLDELMNLYEKKFKKE